MTLLAADKATDPAAALTSVMILLTIAAFVAVWVYVFWAVAKSKGPNPPVFNDAIQYLVPVLTALIGGIVAMVFGVSLATHPQSFPGTGIALFSYKPPKWAFEAYTGAYLTLGVASGVLWVLRSEVTPPLVKNFAMTTIGLVVAVVSATFGTKGLVHL